MEITHRLILLFYCLVVNIQPIYSNFDVCSPLEHHCPSDLSGFWSVDNLWKRAQVSPPHCGVYSSRLCEFREKLIKNKEIKIAVLGGSFAAGTFLRCDDMPQTHCAWPMRLKKELHKLLVTTTTASTADDATTTTAKVEVENLARGGTTTFWAVNAFHRIPHDVDMVIVDYDVNDGALLNDFPNRTRNGVSGEVGLQQLKSKITGASEVLLRWISELPSKPAVMWIESFAYDGRVNPAMASSSSSSSSNDAAAVVGVTTSSTTSNIKKPHLSDASCNMIHQRGYAVGEERKSMLERYGVSYVSLKRAVWPTVSCSIPLKYETSYWECSDTCHHPTSPTHQLLAEWISSYLYTSDVSNCCNDNKDHSRTIVVVVVAWSQNLLGGAKKKKKKKEVVFVQIPFLHRGMFLSM
jgi:hypothetical protein